ncbi:MAG: hypothetical protein HY231_07405 [Acidobacteria bacterium]|nr:hypothetical protein [Acidobacteriota bacterium]
MLNNKPITTNITGQNTERGFTLMEVAVASLITMGGLVFLASLLTLAIGQNRHVKQSTATTMIAQQKMEEMNTLEKTDTRLTIGGGTDEATKKTGYWDQIYVKDSGLITTDIPAGETPHYLRYWKVEADPTLDRTVIISVRVVAVQPAKGRKSEETTLASVRSW